MNLKINEFTLETVGRSSVYLEIPRVQIYATRQAWSWATFAELWVERDAEGFKGIQLWVGPLQLSVDYFSSRKAQRAALA